MTPEKLHHRKRKEREKKMLLLLLLGGYEDHQTLSATFQVRRVSRRVSWKSELARFDKEVEKKNDG